MPSHGRGFHLTEAKEKNPKFKPTVVDPNGHKNPTKTWIAESIAGQSPKPVNRTAPVPSRNQRPKSPLSRPRALLCPSAARKSTRSVKGRRTKSIARPPVGNAQDIIDDTTPTTITPPSTTTSPSTTPVLSSLDNDPADDSPIKQTNRRIDREGQMDHNCSSGNKRKRAENDENTPPAQVSQLAPDFDDPDNPFSVSQPSTSRLFSGDDGGRLAKMPKLTPADAA